MPEITLPPASLPAPAAAAPTANPADDTHGAPESPFAAVLEKQVAASASAAPASPSLVLPNEPVLEATPAGTDSTDPTTSLLPDLLALLGPQGMQALTASGDDKKIADDAGVALPGISAATPLPIEAAVPIALLATVPVQALPANPVADSQTDAEGAGGRTGTPESAILAVTTAVGKQGGESTGAKGADAALIAVAQEQPVQPRGESVTPPATPAHAQPATITRVEAPLGSKQWDGEFANKLAWVVTRNEQRADLVLNPPQLGRVEVSVSLHGDQAAATFASVNPVVRDAIEGALPRLREVLLEAGINLGQTHVGSESPQQSPGRNENRDNQGNIMSSAGGTGDGAANNLTAPRWTGGGRGMIDVFA